MTNNINPDAADVLADRMLAERADVRVYRQLLEHLEDGEYITTPADIADAAGDDPDRARLDMCRHAITLGRAYANALSDAVGHDAAIRAVQRAYATAIERTDTHRASLAESIARERNWMIDRYGTDTNEVRVRNGQGPVDDAAIAALAAMADQR